MILKEQIEEYRALLFKPSRNGASGKEKTPVRVPKKRGAPKGHPGKTRRKPERVDEQVDVYLEKYHRPRSPVFGIIFITVATARRSSMVRGKAKCPAVI